MTASNTEQPCHETRMAKPKSSLQYCSVVKREASDMSWEKAQVEKGARLNMPCPDSTRARFVIVFSEFQKRQVLFDSIRANVEDYELITSSIGALTACYDGKVRKEPKLPDLGLAFI